MTERSIVGSPISLILIGSGSSYAGGPASGTRRALKWIRGRSDIVRTPVFTSVNVYESEEETSRLAGMKHGWNSDGRSGVSPGEMMRTRTRGPARRNRAAEAAPLDGLQTLVFMVTGIIRRHTT